MNCKKLLMGCLVLLMVATLCGCSLLGGGQDKKDKEMMIGTWVSEPLNLTQVINKAFEDEPSTADLAKYMKLDEFSLKLKIDIREDGTYTFAFDPNSSDAAFDQAKDVWAAGMRKYLEDEGAKQGLTLSADAMLEASGMNLDDMMDDMIKQVKSEFSSQAKKDGYYDVKGGKFLMADIKSDVGKKGSYEAFQITEDTLTLVDDGAPIGDVDAAMSDMLKEFYPIVFHRQ